MRFHANGLPIPDRLLDARDDGQVVFFCGAGVSRARANLYDFFSLTDRVVNDLGSTALSSARQLLTEIKRQRKIPGVGAIVSADQVFGLLEREFSTQDIRSAVAAALKPLGKVDLTAHQILVDLSRGPDQQVRLVTTNYDLLFEACNPEVHRISPPSLPDPKRNQEFRGIVHLHGRVTDSYDAAHDDEFVLSSADFGRAYLADGWAANFIRSLMSEYQIVFVGYAADDPPVKYLLEALRVPSAEEPKLYAFQEGTEADAEALWLHKGVQAIPFDSSNNYEMLWQTLGAWARRAHDPIAWRNGVLTQALQGPEPLCPHVRGQVRHIVSTAGGAKQFAMKGPPAEWLCVFDAQVRFAEPSREDEYRVVADPFLAYGLDDDPVPAREARNPFRRAEPPSGAWDAFELSHREHIRAGANAFAALRGHASRGAPPLLERLSFLASWIGQICLQPAAAWWAAGQVGLHPEILERVVVTLGQDGGNPISKQAWDTILSSINAKAVDRNGEWFSLHSRVKTGGWSRQKVRTWVNIGMPNVKLQRSFKSARPPQDSPDLKLVEVINMEVDYPRETFDFTVPDLYLALFVAEKRRCLEIAADLAIGLYGREHFNLPSLVSNSDPYSDDFRVGLSHLFLDFAKSLDRLRLLSFSDWRKELASWPDNAVIFSRLRVWIAGRAEWMNDAVAARMLLSVEDQTFWSGDAQRDLLISLQRRWNTLSYRSRKQLEARLLRGPSRWKGGETLKNYRVRKAHMVLTRLAWLSSGGCQFSFNYGSTISRLKQNAPDWQDEFAERAIEYTGPRSGFVSVDTRTKRHSGVPARGVGMIHEAPDSMIWGRHESQTLRTDGPAMGAYQPADSRQGVRPRAHGQG